jgi:hypothetical protein
MHILQQRVQFRGVEVIPTSRSAPAAWDHPSLSTGLTAMAAHQFSMIRRTWPSAVRGVALMSSMRIPARLGAPGSVVGHHGNGGVAEPRFPRQRRLRHTGHAYHVGTVTLEPIDFRGRLQARTLGGRVYALIDRHLAGGSGRIEDTPAQPVAIRAREVDVQHRTVWPWKLIAAPV